MREAGKRKGSPVSPRTATLKYGTAPSGEGHSRGTGRSRSLQGIASLPWMHGVHACLEPFSGSYLGHFHR